MGISALIITNVFILTQRKMLRRLQLFITNHHLLFTDAQARIIEEIGYDEPAVLPPFQKLVIDEAHNIEKNATDYFTHTYSSAQVIKSVDRLTAQHNGNKHLVDMLLSVIPKEYYTVEIAPIFATLVERVGYLEIYLQDFLRGIKVNKLLIYPTMERQFDRAKGLAEDVEEAIGILPCCSLKKLLPILCFQKSMKFIYQTSFHIFQDYNSNKKCFVHSFYLIKIKLMFFGLRVLIKEVFELHISPLSVANKLNQSIYHGLDTIILTSATLDLHDEFTYWGNRIGLPLDFDKPYIRNAYSSPFDYKQKSSIPYGT